MLYPFQFVPVAVAGWMNHTSRRPSSTYASRTGCYASNSVVAECASMMTSAVAWPPKPKGWGANFSPKSPPWSHPIPCWHRKLIAQKYDGHNKRGPGHPRTREDIETLVVQMAEENRAWGYRRIQRAISNLGHKLARSTIADILHRHGIEPAPASTVRGSVSLFHLSEPSVITQSPPTELAPMRAPSINPEKACSHSRKLRFHQFTGKSSCGQDCSSAIQGISL
jgi:hypothetical protein